MQQLDRSKCSLKVVVSTFPSMPAFEVPEALRVVCQAEHRMLHATWNLCEALKCGAFLSVAYYRHICGYFWQLWTENVWAASLACWTAMPCCASTAFRTTYTQQSLDIQIISVLIFLVALLFSQSMVCQFETLNLNIW